MTGDPYWGGRYEPFNEHAAENERSLDRLSRIVCVAQLVRRAYPDTSERDVLACAVMLVHLGADIETLG